MRQPTPILGVRAARLLGLQAETAKAAKLRTAGALTGSAGARRPVVLNTEWATTLCCSALPLGPAGVLRAGAAQLGCTALSE